VNKYLIEFEEGGDRQVQAEGFSYLGDQVSFYVEEPHVTDFDGSPLTIMRRNVTAMFRLVKSVELFSE
jgi:hypothetical protein